MMTRRQILAGAVTVTGAAGLMMWAAKPAPAQPLPAVDERLRALETTNNAIIGVYAVDLVSGRVLAHRQAETFAMCSSFKTYLAARVLQMADRHELRLDEPMPVEASDIVRHSPRTEERVGATMTLADLCQATLQISDNAAANILLRRIGGPPAITDFARSIGDDRSRLDRWETELNSAVPGDPRDTSTPEALGGGYRALLTGEVLSAQHRQLLEDWMRANETSSMRAGLPTGWTTADKTGSGDYGTTNDVGIAYGPAGERLLLSFMTRSASDDPDAEGFRPMIGEIAAVVVPALTQP